MKIFTDKHIKELFYEILGSILAFTIFSATCARSGKAALSIFLAAICMAVAIAICCYRFFSIQNKIIEDAAATLREYSLGNRDLRIECDGEGELNKLFHEANSLAAILNAHAEKELRSKEFMKNTISDISHQLKTPLAALNIYNGILQDGATSLVEAKEFAGLSEKELDRIETLVQNLLKITKLDAGTIALDKKEEPLYEMLEEIQHHFSFRARQEEKQVLLSGDPYAIFFCDRAWLTEAVENIVKNALDHTVAGCHVTIECKSLPSIAQIIIKDNGSGIHPEDLPHIFKRFYRSHFSKDTQGIGLGLSLAKSIIEMHNGAVEAASELGKGTIFTLTFLR